MYRIQIISIAALIFSGCVDSPEANQASERTDEEVECAGQGFTSMMLPGCKATTCYYQPQTTPRCALVPPTTCAPIPGYCRVGELFMSCSAGPQMRWGTTSNCDTENWSSCGSANPFCADDSHTLICGAH